MSKWDQGPSASAGAGSKWDVGGPRSSGSLQFANAGPQARPGGGMGGCGGGMGGGSSGMGGCGGGMGGCGGGMGGCGGGMGGCGGGGGGCAPSRFSSSPPSAGGCTPSHFASGPGLAATTNINFPSRRAPVVMAPPKPPTNVCYMGTGGRSVPLISTLGRPVPVMGARPGSAFPGSAFTNPHAGLGCMPNLRPGMPGYTSIRQAMPGGGMPGMPNLRPGFIGYQPMPGGGMPGMPNLRPGMPGYHPGLAQPASLPKRSLSPHAGSRAMKEALIASQGGAPVPERDRSRSSKRKRTSSSESSSSSSSSHRKKKKKKRKRSSSSEVEAKDDKIAANQAEDSEEVQKAKVEALAKLTSLQSVEPKDARIKGYRALLREWHPDKNLDRLEVATAVFQFLQKGKRLLNV